jgi:hypothetical protein
MKAVTGVLASGLLMAAAASALAAELPDTATGAIATQPRRSNWNVPYKPKDRHDLTGMWEQKQGAGWVPNVEAGHGQNPPMTPEYRKIWEGLLNDLEAGTPSNNPPADCLPQGMPRIMSMTFPMEVIQNENQINIYAEWNEQTRRIYLDGRPFDLSLDRSYNGQSVGHWEGDVLYVTTVHIRPETNLEGSGLPHSDALIVYEKLWLASDDVMKDEITLVDRKAYTRPWTVTKTYERAPPGYQVMPYVCLENNRNPLGPDGKTTTILQGGR